MATSDKSYRLARRLRANKALMTRLSRRQCCARRATLLCGFAAAASRCPRKRNGLSGARRPKSSSAPSASCASGGSSSTSRRSARAWRGPRDARTSRGSGAWPTSPTRTPSRVPAATSTARRRYQRPPCPRAPSPRPRPSRPQPHTPPPAGAAGTVIAISSPYPTTYRGANASAAAAHTSSFGFSRNRSRAAVRLEAVGSQSSSRSRSAPRGRPHPLCCGNSTPGRCVSLTPAMRSPARWAASRAQPPESRAASSAGTRYRAQSAAPSAPRVVRALCRSPHGRAW